MQYQQTQVLTSNVHPHVVLLASENKCAESLKTIEVGERVVVITTGVAQAEGGEDGRRVIPEQTYVVRATVFSAFADRLADLLQELNDLPASTAVVEPSPE